LHKLNASPVGANIMSATQIKGGDDPPGHRGRVQRTPRVAVTADSGFLIADLLGYEVRVLVSPQCQSATYGEVWHIRKNRQPRSATLSTFAGLWRANLESVWLIAAARYQLASGPVTI
jgi:hypothetical protein